MKEKIFVYGALRKGASNAWRMDSAKWLGETSVKGTLVKIDWYPGLVLDGATDILGEVYEVGEQLLAELDEFEGITAADDARSGEYHRIRSVVELGGDQTEVWIYEWLKGIADYEVVGSGDWLAANS